MSAPRPRHLLPAGALALTLLCTQANAQPVELDLPAQPLAAALNQLASQAGIQLLFNEIDLQSLRSPALQGRFTAEQALQRLLEGSPLQIIEAGGDSFVIQPAPKAHNSAEDGIDLQAFSVIGDGSERPVTPQNAGRSTLTRKEIERRQADNIPSLLQSLPGISMGGSPKPGGQTVNIWGMGEAEDITFTLDGAAKSGFERYQQGTVFIEPELIKYIEVEKGPHSVFNGYGSLGGTVHMETKDAPDLLRDGRNSGAMLKYSYASNNHQQVYSGATYGRTENGFADALLFISRRDSDDLKMAQRRDYNPTTNPINPKRIPYSGQDLRGGLFKLNLHPNEEHDVRLSFIRTKSERWTPFSSKTYPNPPTARMIAMYGYDMALKRLLANRETIDTTLSSEYLFHPLDNPWIDLSLSYSYSKTEQTDQREPWASAIAATGNRRMETSYRDELLELRNVSRFATGAIEHELTLGSALRHHQRMPLTFSDIDTNASYNGGVYYPYFMPAGKQKTASVYLQDALTFGRLTITPSLRFDQVRNQGKANLAPRYNDPAGGHDYSTKSYSGWSPRLGLFWVANDQWSLFADYSKTWRAPVIDEQYEVQSASSTRSATSRGLERERVEAVRAGAVLSLVDVLQASDRLQWRTTLFHNRYKDEIFKSIGVFCEQQSVSNGSSSACTDLPANVPVYRNLDGFTIKGFEFETYYDSDNLFGSLSYSWMTGRHRGAYNNPWGPNVWVRDIPSPKWEATLGVKVPRLDLHLGWQGEFVRKTDRLPSDIYPGGMGSVLGDSAWDHHDNGSYDNHSLFATWTPHQHWLEGTELQLRVENLFNRFYVPALGAAGTYVQGRNAKVSLTRYF